MAGNIPEYNVPVSEAKLVPQDRGMDALGEAGRTINMFGHEAGADIAQGTSAIGNAIEQQQGLAEISQGSAALAAIHNNFTTQWNQTAANADPNDNSIKATFLNDSVEPTLEQWQNGFQTKRGQEWAQGQVTQLRSEMLNRTSADMSYRAGAAIQQNLVTTVNNLAQTARKDPSSMDYAIAQVDTLVNAAKQNTAATLGPENASKLDVLGTDMKNEIVKSGYQGLADVNPQAAIALLNSGSLDQYIKPSEGEEMQKYAEGITRMKLEDQSRAYEQQKRAQEQTDEAAANKIINGIYNADTGQVNIPKDINAQIFSTPGVSAQTKLWTLGAVKRISQDSADDNQGTIQDFAGRLRADSPNPLTHDDLLSALSSGRLSPSTYNFFNGQLKDTVDTKAENDMLTQTLAEQKNNLLGPNTGIAFDPAAEQAYTRFQTWFLPAYQTALKDPALANLSNAQKAQVLLSPDSNKYMLGPNVMARFKPTGDDVVQGSIWSRMFGNSVPGAAPVPPAAAPTPAPAANDPARKALLNSIIFGGAQ